MQTRILLMRHGAHTDNVLTPQANAQAFKVGAWLKANGFVLDYGITSPIERTMATAQKVAEGHMVPDLAIMRNDLLGDIAADTRLPTSAVAVLKTLATEQFGNTSDTSMAQTVLKMPEEFRQVMMRRAQETAEFLQQLARDHGGQDILVVSHAVGRIEIGINWLFGARAEEEVLRITNVTPTCGVYNVVFEDGLAVDERLLDVE